MQVLPATAPLSILLRDYSTTQRKTQDAVSQYKCPVATLILWSYKSQPQSLPTDTYSSLIYSAKCSSFHEINVQRLLSLAFLGNWTVHSISFEIALQLSEAFKDRCWSIGFPVTMVGVGCLTMYSL